MASLSCPTCSAPYQPGDLICLECGANLARVGRRQPPARDEGRHGGAPQQPLQPPPQPPHPHQPYQGAPPQPGEPIPPGPLDHGHSPYQPPGQDAAGHGDPWRAPGGQGGGPQSPHYDPLNRPGPQDPYAQPGGQDPYAQPGGQDPYAQPGGQPAGQDPYAQPGGQDPYSPPGAQDPYAQRGPQDPYGQARPADPYGQPGAQDPYGQQGAGAHDGYGAARPHDPYGQPGGGQDPYGQPGAQDPYAQRGPQDPYGRQQQPGAPYAPGHGADPYGHDAYAAPPRDPYGAQPGAPQPGQPLGPPARQQAPEVPGVRREETLVPPEEQRGQQPPYEATAFMCPHCEAVLSDPSAQQCGVCLRPVRQSTPVLRMVFATGEVKVSVGQVLVLGRDVGQSPVASTFTQYDNVSRRHSTVRLDPSGTAWIRDERSTNGTFVNGERLPAGVEAPLRDGDTVRLAADATGTVHLS